MRENLGTKSSRFLTGILCLVGLGLLLLSTRVLASDNLNFKVEGIWVAAADSVKPSAKYNYEDVKTQDGKVIFEPNLALTPNLWGQLASEVEIWEQKKKLAKLKSETKALEEEPKERGVASDLASLRPIMQQMIQESLADLPSKREVKEKEVKPLVWPKVLAIHGTKSLKCTLRLANGELVRLKAGEKIGDLVICAITRHMVIARQKNVKQVLNFD